MQQSPKARLRILLKDAQAELKQINQKIARQKIAINNPTYFLLLDRAAKLDQRIRLLEQQLKLLRMSPKRLVITMGAKVQLFSDKVGSIYVDSVKYLELVGKQVGDFVVMNNYTFLVAAVY